MKIEGGDQPIRQPLQASQLPPPEPVAQRQFERLLAKAPETDLVERWQKGAPLDSLLVNLAPAAQRDLLWKLHPQGNTQQAAEIGQRLAKPVTSKLVERFGERQLPVVAAIDLPELRALMREFDPLASRREKVLLTLIGELKDGQGAVPAEHLFLDALARRELMTLIPLNGMVANLMRNSHKLDLEA
ncbi:YopR family T3SS polymerization control protein [Aeromonas finlandensis]|uniref:YopR family T3SS polymerization control protein n=1 Tax=Aeromonas finlandensis TaxID=1543375 RepID=UPI00051C0C8E|nr:YopR family T3SS polymerization control protein [Aeromonas finlandensis]